MLHARTHKVSGVDVGFASIKPIPPRHHKVTFPAAPRSSVADSTPRARKTRRIERRDMSSPLSSLEIWDFFTPIRLPSSSWVRF